MTLEPLSPLDRVFWKAHNWRAIETYDDGSYRLDCIDGFSKGRKLPYDEYEAVRRSGDLTVEKGYFDAQGKVASRGSHTRLLANYPVELQRIALVDFTICSLLDSDYKQAKVVLSDARPTPKSGKRRRHRAAMTLDLWLVVNEARIHDACRPFYLMVSKAPQASTNPRKGQAGAPSLGSVSNLQKNYRRFKQADFKIADFVPDRAGMRNGGRRIAPAMKSYIDRRIKEKLLTAERMTVAEFRKLLGGELKAIPELEGRTVPSAGAIENHIRGLDQAKVIGARFGFKEMTERSSIFTEGPGYDRVGEMVIIDSYKIDLVAKLKEGGGWMFIRTKDIGEWGIRRRLWVCLVIDACSRVVLGFAIGFSENSDLTVRALRMALTDKSLYALSAGCKSAPVAAIGFEQIYFDAGPAFKDPNFLIRSIDVTNDAKMAVAGQARLRGGKERYIKSLKMAVLSYFTGTTFGDPKTKGDYDAMARASASSDTIGKGLFLHINDVYNLSAHRGLHGQPPIDHFRERYELGSADPLTAEDIRVVFGVDLKLPLTRRGVHFAGNYYYSGLLATFFKERGPKRLRAKVDTCNLGRISVFFDGAWQTLQGPLDMAGMSFTVWKEFCAERKARFGAQAAKHDRITAAARNNILQMGYDARVAADVEDQTYNSKSLAQAASNIRLRMVERETPTKTGQMLGFDSTYEEDVYFASNDEIMDDDEDYSSEEVPDEAVFDQSLLEFSREATTPIAAGDEDDAEDNAVDVPALAPPKKTKAKAVKPIAALPVTFLTPPKTKGN